MKNILLTFSFVLVTLVFSACGNKAPFEAHKPLPKAALVYIYVVDGMSYGEESTHSEYNIRINDKRYLERIESNEYMVFNLKPNPTLMSAVEGQILEEHIKLNLKEGSINYLRITDTTDGGKFLFEQVSPSIAKEEIAKTGLAGSNMEDPDNIITELIGEESKDDSIVGAKTVSVPQMSEADIDAIIERKLAERTSATATKSVPQRASASKLDEIKEAYEMKKSGVLSDAEFKTIKAEILAK